MVFFQRDQDIGVVRTDQARCGVLKIQGTVWQADVVQDIVDLGRWNRLADVLLDQIAQPRGLLDTGSALRPQMQDKGAGIAAREEVLSEEGQQQEGAEEEDKEDRGE